MDRAVLILHRTRVHEYAHESLVGRILILRELTSSELCTKRVHITGVNTLDDGGYDIIGA